MPETSTPAPVAEIAAAIVALILAIGLLVAIVVSFDPDAGPGYCDAHPNNVRACPSADR